MSAERLDGLSSVFEDTEKAASYLAYYYTNYPARDEGRGGRFFESISAGSPTNRFTRRDLLAVSALSVNVPAHSIETIVKSQSLRELLTAIPADRDIWDEGTEQYLVEDGPADLAWHKLVAINGIGEVIAGKLLAVKRPRLIPIWDAVVNKTLGPPDMFFWLSMQLTLRDGDLQERAEDVRAKAIKKRADEHDFDAAASLTGISTLRVIDVVVWETGKKDPS